MFTISEIETICTAKLVNEQDAEIRHISTDSRQIFPPHSMFVALTGERFDGHDFIPDLIQQGIRVFLISDESIIRQQSNQSISWIIVSDTKEALQQIAKSHRSKFQYPVVGITGSNGKTIVKEWLFQSLSPDFFVVKNPKSFNSQIGVPLSIFGMEQYHNFGIFEAGISKSGEMINLENIIKPTIGMFTNLGHAHSVGFSSDQEKLHEKLTLFQDSEVIITSNNEPIVQAISARYPDKQLIIWEEINQEIYCLGKRITLKPSKNPYYAENIGHCIALLLYLNYDENSIEERIHGVEQLPMRFEILEGNQQNILVNDSYSNDIAGIELLLSQANEIAPNKDIVLVISDFDQVKTEEEILIDQLVQIIQSYSVSHLFGIGSFFRKWGDQLLEEGRDCTFVDHTRELLSYNWGLITDSVILLKGARKRQLEQLVQKIRKKRHDTVWEINLSHVIHNINQYRSELNNGVKLMVMLKATGYGAEVDKLAQLLAYQKVDYFGVAYPEEGAALRNMGISTPIFVMNTSRNNMNLAIEHNLEIEVFSLNQFELLIGELKETNKRIQPIHIKLETGMNRLGFSQDMLPKLKEKIVEYQEYVEVKGILSHLACADQESKNEFSLKQIETFQQMAGELIPPCAKKPLLHILNTSGITNPAHFPQFDMVRLGIGLHGISADESMQWRLRQIGTLRSSISQIKWVNQGESVGYGQSFIAPERIKIAVISIGYADGYDRRFSNGVGEVLVNNKRRKVVGTVCMDMLMIQLDPDDKVEEGDEVVLSSESLPILELSKRINTIAYELLTSISARVQRQFIYE